MKYLNETKMNSEKTIISVYKTTIGENDLNKLKAILDSLDRIIKWTTDLDDCDNILRIVSQYSIEGEVIKALSTVNITCIELN